MSSNNDAVVDEINGIITAIGGIRNFIENHPEHVRDANGYMDRFKALSDDLEKAKKKL